MSGNLFRRKDNSWNGSKDMLAINTMRFQMTWPSEVPPCPRFLQVGRHSTWCCPPTKHGRLITSQCTHMIVFTPYPGDH